jgi:hypothetical protein
MNRYHAPLPRALTPTVVLALRSHPVVVLTGARQTGKSTLIRELLPPPKRDYRTLDETAVLDRSRQEPDALLAGRLPLTLDEIQRSPELLLAVKRSVDRDRRPGRFLLSGSANLALMRRVSESLAGRAVYLVLYPFTPSERRGGGGTGKWDALVRDPRALEGTHAPFERLEEAVTASGFPPAWLARGARPRQAWLDGYVRTYLDRDLQQLAAIENLADFRRLMRIVALRSGGLENQSSMARDAGLPQPRVRRYLNLMETSYLLHRLPAYGVNRTRRLVKAPRMFLSDGGLAAFLAGIGSPAELRDPTLAGMLLETLVLGDLLAWREGAMPRPEVLYWRTVSGAEVDFVIETGRRLVPVEVKAASRVGLGDARHVASFLREYPGAARHGLVLYSGARMERLADRIWAVPLTAALSLAR